MKKILFVCAMLSVLGMSSCQDEKNLYEEKPVEELVNTSVFSTSQTVQVAINYSVSNAKTLFYVYDKNPLTFGENTVSLDETIKPLDAAWTDDNGKFTGTMKLPAYVSDVFIVTGMYSTPLMTGKIINGTLTVSDTDVTRSTTRATTAITRFEKGRFAGLGWSTALGGFDQGTDESTGEIDYKYTGSLALTTEEVKAMQTMIWTVLNSNKTCPAEYRTDDGDLYVTEDNTEVVLTSLGSATCWNNSLGYYFYKENEVPTSLEDVTVYTVFPNCQKGGWKKNVSGKDVVISPIGVTDGTAVQLKYFDEENQDGTIYFPKGYRIGFVLACNAWDTHCDAWLQWTRTYGFYSCSTKALNTKVEGKGVYARTAMFSQDGIIAMAFEDFSDDQNFTDVFFALKSKGLSDVPIIDKDYNTTVTKSGIYGFEDEWPRAADYDMNDVMAEYTYAKTFNTDNVFVEESFTFQTFANRADLKNGLAFILKDLSGTFIVEDSVMKADADEYVPTTFERETDNGNTIVKFIDNVKDNMNAKFKVTVKYDKDLGKKSATETDAFIYRSSNGNRLEVHCPMLAPTSFADMSLFGTLDDRSIPGMNIYYVSDKDNVYPFAFYLDNANVADIAPLLETENESKPISEIYPDFIDWAKTGNNPGWYK